MRLVRHSTLKKLHQGIRALEKKVRELEPLQFREGDVVYIVDGERDPLREYYLIKEYGSLGGTAWIVDTKPGRERAIHNEMSDGVQIRFLRREPPKQCRCCGHILKEDEYGHTENK